MRRFQRAVLWRRLDQPGREYCALWSDEAGWELEGTALVALDGRPYQARYQVVCDMHWRTRSAGVELQMGAVRRDVQITVDDQQRWWVAGEEFASVRGCLDVDFSLTPATNTLPIRRLGLAVGEGRELTAAWVRFPDLGIQPLPQKYTRLGEKKYRYESGSGSFVTEIEVDDMGLVTRYLGGWERESEIGTSATPGP